MTLSVTKIVKVEEKILLNLWQKYMNDLSEFRSSISLTDGRYRDDRLRTYFAYDGHWAYLIRYQEEIAGFALVRKSEPGTYTLGEFFIQREFRKIGVGSQAVSSILGNFSGNWQIPFQNDNPNAAKFWRQTIEKLGYSASESSQANDVLLSFTTCD